MSKKVLILGANSDVAKACLLQYSSKGYSIVAASRSTESLKDFTSKNQISDLVEVMYFDATDFESHLSFYEQLPFKPEVVVYAAGFLQSNSQAMQNWNGAFNMMKVHYCGAVSIINIIVSDTSNTQLKSIVGLSSLSGVRGRKSNFIYGSTKSAFTQYLTGLRQYLAHRQVNITVVVAGYIQSKMTEGLDLNQSLMLSPEFIARAVVNAKRQKVMVPGWKWKIIYLILKVLPESLVAKLP